MRHGPLFVTAVRMAFAVAALLPVIAVGQGGLALPAFMAKRWIAPIFLGAIAGAVQFLPFMWGLRWLPPTTTVLYLPPNLIAAMVLGIVALGECLTDELLAGMAFVLMGIAVGSSAYADLRKARARLSG
jgi:drug/metabolite transporter (DMT)-like permease